MRKPGTEVPGSSEEKEPVPPGTARVIGGIQKIAQPYVTRKYVVYP